jgi:hypothetical protein
MYFSILKFILQLHTIYKLKLRVNHIRFIFYPNYKINSVNFYLIIN